MQPLPDDDGVGVGVAVGGGEYTELGGGLDPGPDEVGLGLGPGVGPDVGPGLGLGLAGGAGLPVGWQAPAARFPDGSPQTVLRHGLPVRPGALALGPGPLAPLPGTGLGPPP